MVKRSEPDEIALDKVMQESMKEMGKGEMEKEEIEVKPPIETSQNEQVKPQFGFKLTEVKTPESLVVPPKKKAEKQVVKEQIILEKPSESLDDDIVVEW